MNIAAYCRVSTDKTDQINSLEAQKNFLRSTRRKTDITLFDYMRTREFREQRQKIVENFCVL